MDNPNLGAERDPKEIRFDVVGGMCNLVFRVGSSCGRDPNCNPGIGFDCISTAPASYHRGRYYSGTGVFSRADAKRLADAIYEFLETNPPAR